MPPRKKSVQDTISREELIGTLKNQLDEAMERLDLLEARFGRLEVASPPELRKLDLAVVNKMIHEDQYAQFEVLADWSRGHLRFAKGQVIRADHYRALGDYVSAGLLLGLPEEYERAVTAARASAAMRRVAMRDVKVAEAEKAYQEAKKAMEQAKTSP